MWSAILIHIYPPFWASLPFRHPTAPGHHRALGWAPYVICGLPYSILHKVMYKFQCYSLYPSHPLFPLLCPQVCPVRLHLYSCPADRFICTIFLYSIYIRVNIRHLFFSFWHFILCDISRTTLESSYHNLLCVIPQNIFWVSTMCQTTF